MLPPYEGWDVSLKAQARLEHQIADGDVTIEEERKLYPLAHLWGSDDDTRSIPKHLVVETWFPPTFQIDYLGLSDDEGDQKQKRSILQKRGMTAPKSPELNHPGKEDDPEEEDGCSIIIKDHHDVLTTTTTSSSSSEIEATDFRTDAAKLPAGIMPHSAQSVVMVSQKGHSFHSHPRSGKSYA